MPLTINSPTLERRLARAAQEQRTTPVELAVQLLEALLPGAERPEVETSSKVSTSSSEPAPSGILPAAERRALFHRWLEDNKAQALPSLPGEAFERASFYDDERHLHTSAA